MKPEFNIRSTLFLLFFLSLTVLAVINALAVEYYLYWRYLWLDIPMHLFAGVVISLGILGMFPAVVYRSFPQNLLLTLAIVIGIGVTWEIIDYSIDMLYLGSTSHISDTIFDLVLDVVGGGIGFFVARSIHTLEHV